MNKKTNLIYTVITYIVTLSLIFVCAVLVGKFYTIPSAIAMLPYLLIGLVVFGFINALFHELGHFIAGKRNGFILSTFSVWFFKWKKVGKKTRFSLSFSMEEWGATEMIPDSEENMAKRLKKLSLGGIIASGITCLISIVPLFLHFLLVKEVYCIFIMWLPISAYYLFNNGLPIMNSVGVCNDGGVVYGIVKNTDDSVVNVSLLKIHAQLYQGKTPSQISEEYYFNLPQLREDSLTFITLLNARYNYYLDKEDFDGANKTLKRLETLLDYMPPSVKNTVKVDLLYSYCTFNYNEDKADELMYELEKYLSNRNETVEVRTKLAYLLKVVKEVEDAQIFVKKLRREINRHQISGLAKMEEKLLTELIKDHPNL